MLEFLLQYQIERTTYKIMTPIMVVAVLRLHLLSLPYAQLAQPEPLLEVVVLLELVVVVVARLLELVELEELEDLSLSLLDVFPMDFP
jgi:hypothetical protein